MSPRGPRRRIGRGRYEDRSGVDAYVHVKGIPDHQRFPKTQQGRKDAAAWQDKRRAELRKQAKDAPSGPLVEDVRRYLAAVSMPTIGERELHLGEWCAAFGPRRRDDISAPDIRAVLEDWRTARALSASALNHRRTALQHFYTVLNGKGGDNPVRDVPRYKEPEALPRGLEWATIRAILRAMPPSVTRVRLALIAWTGLPHTTLMKVTRADVDTHHRTLARPGRSKGKGTRAQLVPLMRRAVWYFKLLDRYNGWGSFSTSSMRGCFRRACRAVEREAAKRGETLDLSALRPYDLRHSFGSLVYAATHDLQATAVLMGHSSLTTTRRYTLAAVPAALTAAVAKVEAKIAKSTTPAHDPATPETPSNKGQLVAFTPLRARSSAG